MCELTIQERALNHNIRLVRREAGNAKLIGVVKGNGYGLGLAELAGRLVDGGVRTLAVSELSDALKLRCYGIPAEIMRSDGSKGRSAESGDAVHRHKGRSRRSGADGAQLGCGRERAAVH